MKRPHISKTVLATLVALGFTVASCSDSSESEVVSSTEAPVTVGQTETSAEQPAAVTTEAAPSFEGELVGKFVIDAAVCSTGAVGGSYFRMIQPGGTLGDGPFVPNADSSCEDSTFTPMLPGSDGGLTTGAFQSAPDPPFNDSGDGLASRVVAPTPFFAVAFAIATEDDGNTPSITATNGILSGDLSSWTAYYGNLVFLQGAPLPDGSMPGLTSAVTGSIDPTSGAYVLEWSSQIDGGSFNEFTGVWHLEGIFEPAN